MTHPHFINNQWVTGTGTPFLSRNPATEELLWQGNSANGEEINAAVTAARQSLPTWSLLPFNDRTAYLKKFKEQLEKNLLDIAEAISKEIGKPLWEAKTEVNAVIGKIDISIEAYLARCPTIEKKHPAGISITRHKPHGVMAVFGPYNFPAHLPHGHIIPALLAGNTVVYKPSESAPLIAELLMKLWEKCDLPPGVLNMIQGGRETGRTLAMQPEINGICFTGSWDTGLILSEILSKHPEKILALEMGGNNPLVVFDVADLTAAAYTTIQSAYITSGQRCSCARRLIIPQNKFGDSFLEKLIALIKTIKVGPYTDTPEPFMGPVINEKAAQHLLGAQSALIAKGANPLIEMHLRKIDTALLSPGLIDVTNIHHRPDEEIFGPLLQVIRVPDFKAAIFEANQTLYGLTAGLLSDKKEQYEQFFNEVLAGVINWNTPTTGASSAAPFGGIGHSGNNRPSAFYAADYCAYPVASIEAQKVTLPKELSPGITLDSQP